jgi:filamentous hemagglutinin family protein
MPHQMKSGSAFPAPSVSDPRPRGRRALLAALLGGVALPGALLADPLPTGGTVASGTVGIATPGAQSMVITQGSDRAVVNWDSFSIGSGAHVDIRQPDAGSALLNRVTGDTTSAIHGRLTANGQVHLVNPNGIFIGANGKVDAGSFVASTLNISDDDFLAGRLRYGGTGASGTVRNAGRVTVVPGGYAAFLGGRVRNEGVVTVPMGRIGFASGERVTLDLSGDQFLQVAIPTGGDDDGKALVENSGTASAEGGLIEMRAATAREAVRHAVNLSGVAEARSVSVRNGVITLGGGAGGRVTVSGRATTATAAPTGAVLTSARPRARPEVRITGAHIDLAGARIDASGAGGGGLIRIGGDFAGAGALPRAETLTADATTEIRADAIGTGDGGRIALWSDLRSDVAARLSARGGDNGGDGGFIEVSSARTLSYSGLADTRAPMGAWGTLLLDPQDIVIDPGAGGEDTLEANLESGNVTLDTFEPSVPDAGDITINANIDWMAETTLTLDADNDIFLNGAINGPNGGFSLFAAGNITPAAAVNVDDFRLFNGSWSQLGTLPAFDVDSFSLSSGATFLRALGGDGGTSPYRLTDIYGVQGVGTLPGDNFVLANDIDASGTLFWSNFDGLGFAPIQSFDAVFDGDQHRISGLYSESGFEGLNNTAMFYNIGSNATVRDLTLSDVEIVGRGAAALAYINNGLIENTRVSGTVTSEGYVTGGLVAINNGTIEDTAISVDVTATHVSDGEVNTVGGFVGSSSGSIARSNTTGSVTVVNSAGAISLDVGGFAGRGDGITDSYSWADVDVSGGGDPDATIAVGGFIGTVTGPVTRSYSTGAVTTSGNATFSTGGFAGRDLSSGGTANNLWDVQSSGQATSAVGTGLSTAQLQDTEAFFGLAAMAGGDFLQVWAPGDTGFYPVNYSTSPVILASPDALSVQYGLTGDASATGTTFGGPDPYVFDAPSDSIDPADLAAIFDALTFASTDAGTTTFTLDTTSVTSAGGVTHRVIDRIGAAEITPAPLTITPDDVTKTYGQSVTLDGFSTSTLYFSDSVGDVTLTSDGTAGSAPVVGSPYDINASDATGTGLENYTITYATGDLTVTPAPLTISANDQTKTYGTAFDFDGDEFTATGLLFADRIETLGLASDGAAADAPVAGRALRDRGVRGLRLGARQLHDHLCLGRDDRSAGAADDHRRQPDQDLWRHLQLRRDRILRHRPALLGQHRQRRAVECGRREHRHRGGRALRHQCLGRLGHRRGQLRDHLCARHDDRGPGAADDHRRQPDQDLWRHLPLRRDRVHRHRPALLGQHRQRRAVECGRREHRHRGGRALRHQCLGRLGHRRGQLRDHLCARHDDRGPGAADDHRRQPDQDLWRHLPFRRDRVHHRRTAIPHRHRDRARPVERGGRGRGHDRGQPLRDHRLGSGRIGAGELRHQHRRRRAVRDRDGRGSAAAPAAGARRPAQPERHDRHLVRRRQ